MLASRTPVRSIVLLLVMVPVLVVTAVFLLTIYAPAAPPTGSNPMSATKPATLDSQSEDALFQEWVHSPEDITLPDASLEWQQMKIDYYSATGQFAPLHGEDWQCPNVLMNRSCDQVAIP